MSKPTKFEPDFSPRPTKGAHLHVRVSDDQLERWQQAAKRKGVKFSVWVTAVLDAAEKL